MFPSCLCSDILAFLPCLVQKTYKFNEELEEKNKFTVICRDFIKCRIYALWGTFLTF